MVYAGGIGKLGGGVGIKFWETLSFSLPVLVLNRWFFSWRKKLFEAGFRFFLWGDIFFGPQRWWKI